MKIKVFLILFLAVIFALSVQSKVFSDHPSKDIKGTVIKIEPVEYEITLKDDKGNEVKTRVKNVEGIKAGDSVVVKDGKVKKAVKPITGGY